MRKYITLLLFFVLSVATFAVDYTPMDKNAANALYLEATLQAGTTGNINIYMKSSEEIGTITMQFFLPEGIDIADDVKGTATEGTISIYPGQPDGSVKLAISGLSFNNPTATKIASFPVTVNAAPGNYKINAYQYQMVTPAIDEYKYNNVSTDLIVQKTAVINPLPNDYALEVIPFAAKEGTSTIDVLFKAPATTKSVTFDIELPQGMMFYDENFDPSKPVLNASACTKTPTVSLSLNDDTYANKATVSVTGQNTGAAALRKYINQLDELTTLVSIPVYVVPTEEIADWGDDYALNEGVYEAKLNNIVVTDYASNATYTGNYIATVAVGQPSAQEAILYGHYTSDAVSSFNTALKNVAIADVTAATVDAKFEDVIVNTKDGSYYSRTSANYGTTCLPYSLTGEYYTVKEMTASSIILEEVSTTTPNEPYIFKGTIDATDANQVTTLGAAGQKSISTTTFKGTYSATNIADGAGYYIATDGKFYSDGATVRPFRAYFDGAVAGVKSFNVLIDSANGLIDITDQLSEDAIYSLQGIRMNNAQKGIIIKGGKKIYVK